jgi:hypothetical protein
MSKRREHTALLDRFRRTPALRVLLVLATLLASQSSLACAFEAVAEAAGSELVAGTEVVPAADTEGCCSLCFDCAYCGSCSLAASLRADSLGVSFELVLAEKLTPATEASHSWTPPALLRPPITVA